MTYKNNIKKQSIIAFTLLEMAVVITVIGLLLGAVTVAKSYIKNSQLNALVTESKYYMSAFNQFQAMYKSVPGDMPTANSSWSGTSSGDGNGVISAKGVGNAPNTPEIFLAFQHLALAGFIDGGYTGIGPATMGSSVPRSKYEGGALFFDHPDALDGNVVNDALYFDGYYGHVLRVAAQPNNGAGVPATGFLTPAQMVQIDTKFDDGKPGTGWIMSPKQSALGGCASSDATSAVYTIASTAARCYLILRLQ